MDELAGPSRRFNSVFLDPAWLVAFIAGCWGVLISLEEFRAADFFAVLAGIIILLKVGAETHFLHKDRRPGLFVFAFLGIIALIGGDLRWTAHKQGEAEEHDHQLAQLSELPGLRDRLQKMEEVQGNRAEEQRLQSAKAGQQLTDIDHENKTLKKTVEQKDAALVAIAKEQYALNFFPQLSLYTNGNDSTGTMVILNNGKTNIEITGIEIAGLPSSDSFVSTIVPNNRAQYTLQPEGSQGLVILAASQNGGDVPFEGLMRITTLDYKKYRLSFTWHFIVAKGGRVEKSFVVNGKISEDK